MAYLRWLFKAFQGEIVAVPWRLAILVCVLLLFIAPLVTQNSYIWSIIFYTCLFAIYAASWDLLAGCTGQFSLGHAGFFGIGAYISAMLNLGLKWPPVATIPIASLAAALTGLIAGFPALRLRGIYFTLASVAFPFVLMGIVFAFPQYTGGEYGLAELTPLSDSKQLSVYIGIMMMLLCVAIMWKITDIKSGIVRTGIIFRSIREDEIAARTSGINTIKYKLLAFAISSFFAGISGGLYAHYLRIAGPANLELWMSFQPIIWTVFGGMGTITGAVAGTFIIFPGMELLRIVQQVRMLIAFCIIMLVILFMPEGIIPWIRDKTEQECPRCKVVNVTTRKLCRACNTPLHLEQK